MHCSLFTSPSDIIESYTDHTPETTKPDLERDKSGFVEEETLDGNLLAALIELERRTVEVLFVSSRLATLQNDSPGRYKAWFQ
jgi:hypothetical protein